MGSRKCFCVLLLLSALAIVCKAQPKVFDITKYGAKSDGSTDNTQALLDAWKETCATTGSSKLIVPKGTYFLGSVEMKGPCKGSVEFELQGTLKAPKEPKDHKDPNNWVTFSYLDNFSLYGGGTFDGQGEMAWGVNNCAKTKDCKILPISLRFDYITNGEIRDITSLDSKYFHVNVLGCKNVTFQHFTVTAPKVSPNTDGIHIGRSNGVTIIDSDISTGDDCISLGDGSQQVHITNVTCGPGHGISVGSLGKYKNEEPVSGIFVKNCTLVDTENGVRIKSWPAMFANTASDMHFEDILMKEVSNPVLIDQVYCPWNQCNPKMPSKVKISNVSFKNIRGTSTTALAVQLNCSSGIPCEDVELEGIDLTYKGPEGPVKSACANVKPKITGKLSPAV
ncbi:exopolygalacturonase-like [Mercurialis annua]|uniref:exopolygalacturonase-like n=1 Tax=Mercurialis annua TaxID=3986 RepID=UPI0021603097|nr:exopolygalacturonase-like [Mercurialis annua]